MSDAEGRGRGCRGSRRSAWAVRRGMGLALVIISLAGWGGGMPPSGVLAGPNDPPDVNATVASTDPNDPNAVPTPTLPSGDPADVTPTDQVPIGLTPEDTVVPPATATPTPAGIPTEQVPPTDPATRMPTATATPDQATSIPTPTATTTSTATVTPSPLAPTLTATPSATPTVRATVPRPTVPGGPPEPRPQPSPPPPPLVRLTVAPIVRPTVPVIVRPTVPPVILPRTATIRLSGWICDGDGFDPYLSDNYLALLDHCTTAASFDFELTVYTPHAIFPFAIDVTAGPGATVETTVPAAATVRLAHLATGFASAVVNCQSSFSGGVLGGAYPDWGFDVHPAEVVDCTWFAVRPDHEINLAMEVRVCAPDPGFAATAAPPSTELFQDRCTATSTVLPVQIDLTTDDPGVDYRATPDTTGWWMTSTSVVFLDLPPDVYTMTVTPPPGYSRAFLDYCGPIAGFGSPVSSILPQTGAPSSYKADFGTGGTTYRCTWYLVPSS